MRSRRQAVTALGVAAVLAAISSRGARPASVQDPFESGVETLHITSREIVVDIMVTDSRGNPVRGLKQSDFTVEENGKPQPIRSFREYSAANQVPDPPAPKLPPGVYTNSQSMPATGPVNILLLDAIHTSQPLMVPAEQQAALYLRDMPGGARVAIFWLSESGLHMLQGFTSDRELLVDAMSNAQSRVDFGWSGDRWSGDKATAAALNQIAAYVSAIKGRKNLFWFTPGMPIDVMRDGGYAWVDGDPGPLSKAALFMGSKGAPDMNMVHRLMDTYELLTTAQVAIYPVDPRGPGPMGWATLKVEAVAEDTGGQAIYNTNDLTSAIAKAVDDGSQFYTLSYIPPKQKDDGHYHHIEVKVDRPGLTLVYRKGYNAERAPTVDTPAPGPALMKAAMEGNAPAATQILFDVGVWPSTQLVLTPAAIQPKKSSKSPRTIRYEIRYGLPASQIAFAQQPDGTLRGALEIDAIAYDFNRARVAFLSQTVKMPLRVDQYDDFAAKPFRFTQQLDLPLGQISLHVGILDTVDNKAGTLEIPLLVTPNPALGPTQPVDVAPCPPRCPLPQPAPAPVSPR